MNRKQHIRLGWIFGLVLLQSIPALAGDPGIPDTVYISGGPLALNQSRPITLSVTNDEAVAGWSLGFLLTSLDGGFARFDSARWVGRTADPSIFGSRTSMYCVCEPLPAVSPDIVVLGAERAALNNLPPGRGEVVDLYFTGLSEGSFSIDSVFFPPAGYFMFVNGNDPDLDLFPQFLGCTILVTAGNIAPALTGLGDLTGLVGSDLTLTVTGTSGVGGMVSLSLTDFVSFDDAQAPTNSPTLSGTNPLIFHWTPASTDVGVWSATFEACDTLGICVSRSATLQVVADAQYIIEFAQSQRDSTPNSTGIAVGDADGDGIPEVYVSGNSNDYSPEDDYYDILTGPTLGRIAAHSSGLPVYSVVSGLINGDDLTDFVMMKYAAAFPYGYHVRSLLSNGDNTFSETYLDNGGFVTRSCAIAELTGDAHLDVVTTWYDGIRIYSGNSQGAFALVKFIPSVDTALSVNTGDFNGDGFQDLAVGTSEGLDDYLADGSGDFILAHSYSQSNASLQIEVTNQGSDFDDNGSPDLCISTPSVGGTRSQMRVYFGNSDGSFNPSTIRDVAGQIFGNSVGDVNNDGELDIVYVNGAKRYVAVLFGDAAHTFANELRFSTGEYYPRHVACLDADSDGDLDLIVTGVKIQAPYNVNAVMLFENHLDPGNFQRTLWQIDARDNARLAITTPSGGEVSPVRNTAASALMSERNADLNNRLDTYAQFSAVEQGTYTIKARPRPEAAPGETFSIEFERAGMPYRVAKNVPMSATGYDFGVCVGSTSPITPRPGSFAIANPPTLRWQGQGSFDIQVATDPAFANIVASATVSNNWYQPAQPLQIQDTTAFYWRVKHSEDAGYGDIYSLNLVAATVTCGDADANGALSVSDVVYIIRYVFAGGPAPTPLSAADADCSGAISISDVVRLINYIFAGGTAPCAGCK
jgi:hypothetical protein